MKDPFADDINKLRQDGYKRIKIERDGNGYLFTFINSSHDILTRYVGYNTSPNDSHYLFLLQLLKAIPCNQ